MEILRTIIDATDSKDIIVDGFVLSIDNSIELPDHVKSVTIKNCMIINCRNMFMECENVESIRFVNCKFAHSLSTSKMFYNCYSLNHVDIDIEDISSAEYMFYNCHSLQSIRLNLRYCNNMRSMFQNCYMLERTFIGSVKNVVNLSNAFYGCCSLKSIDLSTFDTKNVTDMRCMFSGCCSLKEVDLSNFNLNDIDTTDMFECCNSLESDAEISTDEQVSITIPENGIIENEHITCIDNPLRIANVKFINCKIDSIRFTEEIESVEFIDCNMSELYNAANMFKGCCNLKNITGLNATNIINMSQMFMDCTALESIDLSEMKTDHVIRMTSMFENCKCVKEIDISSFTSKSILNCQDMFRGCSSLKKLALNNFHIIRKDMFDDEISIDILAERIDDFIIASETKLSKHLSLFAITTKDIIIPTVDEGEIRNVEVSKIDDRYLIMCDLVIEYTKKKTFSIMIDDLYEFDISKKRIELNIVHNDISIDYIITCVISKYEEKLAILPDDVNVNVLCENAIMNIYQMDYDVACDVNVNSGNTAIITLPDGEYDDLEDTSFELTENRDIHRTYRKNGKEDVKVTYHFNLFVTPYSLTDVEESIHADNIKSIHITGKDDTYVADVVIECDVLPSFRECLGYWIDITIDDENFMLDASEQKTLTHLFHKDNCIDVTVTYNISFVFKDNELVDITDDNMQDIYANCNITKPMAEIFDASRDRICFVNCMLNEEDNIFSHSNYFEFHIGGDNLMEFKNENTYNEYLRSLEHDDTLIVSNIKIPRVSSLIPFDVTKVIFNNVQLTDNILPNAKTVIIKNCRFEKYVSETVLIDLNLDDLTSLTELCIDEIELNDYDVIANKFPFFEGETIIFNKCKFHHLSHFFEELCVQNIYFNKCDFSCVEDCDYCFNNCFNLKTIKIEFINRNIKSIEGLCSHCSSLESIDICNNDVNGLEVASKIFFNCSNLKEINIYNNNGSLSNLKDISYAYRDCKNLEMIDLSNFNLSNIENIIGVLYGCSSLKELRIPSSYKHSNIKKYLMCVGTNTDNVIGNGNDVKIYDYSKKINTTSSAEPKLTIPINDKEVELPLRVSSIEEICEHNDEVKCRIFTVSG